MPIIDRKGTIALIFAIIYILIPTTTAAQEAENPGEAGGAGTACL